MAGPWEKYAKQAEQPAAGPWTKYAKRPTAAADVTAQPSGVPDDVRARWQAAKAGTLEVSPESAARHEAAAQAGAEMYPDEPGFWGRAVDALSAGAAGASRGVTGLLDLPGMFTGGVGNLAASGMERAGIVSPGVAQGMRDSFNMMPMGDGDNFRDAASTATGGGSEFRGDTTLGKYAGTVGEFLPGSLIGGGGGAMRNLLTYGVVPGIASEAAGQATEGTAMEPWARVIAPMVASGVAARLTRGAGPQAPSVDDLRAQADDLYRAGDARQAADATAVQGLAAQIDGELQALNVKTPTGRVVADGNVRKFLDVLEDYQGQPMPPQQMQTARRILQDAAASADPSDRRIGTALLEKFDEWRGQHVPEFAQADEIYGRMTRAQDVDWRIEKAENRAGSTGTGGNQVNAARQNIRQILDNPKAQRGYSAAELDAMRAIVRGDTATNALRNVGKLSPTSGALPLMGSLTGVGIAPHLAIPAMGVAAAAKGSAELMTKRQIGLLSGMIRNGGPLQPNTAAQADRGLLGLLVARAVSAEKERKR